MTTQIPTWHLTNSSRETSPTAGPFEGGQLIAFSASVGAGISCFLILGGDQGAGLLANAIIASAIPGMATIGLVKLYVGKPKSYATDWLEWLLLKAGRTKALIELPNRRKE